MLVEITDKNGNTFIYEKVSIVEEYGIFIAVFFNDRKTKALHRAETIDRLQEIKEAKDGNKL